MSDIIRLLPDSVANQIAAGEVIQRPASVVKELVENAVDAGATDIQIIIRDAGRTLVQVVDNGKGMSDTDARMAFERHATSKIQSAADLFSLHTMGFRGEALASIAAVAQVDLRTMQKDSDIGTRLIVNGSKVESQQPEACAPGTNMMVKNLFFNVPARRKFLKKDSVELSNILREFERLALVNHTIDFSLVHNDSVLHKMRGGALKQRIVDLFGHSLDRQLLPVNTDTSIVRIDGFVGLPEHARKRNVLQYLFVNGRHMRHPYFHKAVMQCYEALVKSDEQPNYFLYFTVDPDTIDVNIHPTKNEIKFENEAAIWQIIIAAVKEALGRYNAMPGIDFDVDDAPEIPVFDPTAQATVNIELDSAYNPFDMPVDDDLEPARQASSGISNVGRVASSLPDWEKMYADFTSRRGESVVSDMPDSATEGIRGSALNDFVNGDEPYVSLPEMDSSQPLYQPGDGAGIQVKNRYILTPAKSGVMVVEQHRAHVKVLYERYMELWQNNGFVGQNLLFPEVLRLTASQNALLVDLVSDLASIGFDLTPLGDNDWSISSVPSVLSHANPVETVVQMLEAAEHGGDASAEALHSRVALSMARAEAVRTGTPLSASEREQLLADLFALPAPNYTPDGLLIISMISSEKLADLFL
ncbi:MAG: DNA mismatch repair endonuclease MutL [Paramuribaculum sp.]|nr:DNA mismatch repair endonuclease MutL [Paramuribaculum sp.]